MKRMNKVWKEHEKYQLWVAYRIKVPLDVMEEYFNRTKTSINKYLARSGIRDQLRNNPSIPSLKKTVKTVAQFNKIIIHFGLDNETVGIERQTTRNWKPSTQTQEKMLEIGLPIKAPWSPKKKNLVLPKKSGIGRQSKKNPWFYVSMETIEHYMIRNGYELGHYHRKNAYGWTYLLNNKMVTNHILLGTANMLRLKNNEPKFLVEGITYE